VNAYDIFVAMGGMKDFVPYEFPAVIGMDVAGEVVAAGEGVDGPPAGTRVFGRMGDKPVVHDGTFGELVTAQAAWVRPTPDGVDDEHAGALCVAGTTAFAALNAVDAPEDGTILIVGATGGVGSLAVQLAAARGMHVIASVRPGDEAFVTDLGAAETVDYTAGDLSALVREHQPDGIDGVIDLVNRDPQAFVSLAALAREGGGAASAVGGAGESTAIGGVRVANIGSDASLLEPLARMVADGAVRVAIRATYPLADAARALSDFANEHTVGKSVIAVG
jgi:NADPH:quinone reductase-like Zn-dependent oxidoreductase